MEAIFQIARQFQIKGQPRELIPITIGHINQTYQINSFIGEQQYSCILQKLNTHVFRNPEGVMNNIDRVASHLESKGYPKLILKPITTLQQLPYLKTRDGDYWRAFPFFENTYTTNLVDEPDLAWEVAFNFGEYARYLADLDPQKLVETIPGFHHTPQRYRAFRKALKKARESRLQEAANAIKEVIDHKELLAHYPAFSDTIRVVHYDTKINNILLDQDTGKGVCVIDLDTIMPGMLPYDFGDMVRTITPPVDENEKDLAKVHVRKTFLDALTSGYLEGLQESIQPIEEQNLNNGASLIIYEQAIRFLTDFLEDDHYYPVEYAQQNLIRARNQLVLLNDFLKLINKGI